MNLPFLLARRYLIAKKSHNAINIISWVSVCGVAVITMALICTLSVYNGFQDLISTLYSTFDAELKIEPVKGKTFHADDSLFTVIRQMPEISVFGEVLEENVLVGYGDRQIPATVKGVERNFRELTDIDKIILNGEFILNDSVVDYATVGVGLASQLGVNAGFVRPLDIYVPRRKGRINMSNPTESFNQGQLFVGGVFGVNQAHYDDQMLLAPLDFARDLFESEGLVSSVELKLKQNTDQAAFQAKLQKMLGTEYRVRNRMQQQEESFRIMQIEKWMTFLMLSFILMIASFNVVGSLSMLIVDKQADIRTLRNLGADNSLIKKVFIIEGCLISGAGAVTGIVLGSVLCWVQEHFGVLRLGGSSGMFIVDAYPVKQLFSDSLWVVLVVSLLGLLAAIYPAQTMIKKYDREI
ncbi:MAG: FtsX-like permease family protein [Bacteroidales bacterium]